MARAYGEGESALEAAAAGIWALKTIGGWDESALMTFRITHMAEVPVSTTHWVSVRGEHGPQGWTVEAWRARRATWQAVREETDSTKTVVLADVDWAMPYNDAYGHPAGDLMLARVHACIELAALRAGATFVRVGGEEYAVVVEGGAEIAARFAESIRQDVEAMNITFAHPEVRTHGRVTVSLGVASAEDDLRKALEAAVDEAKRSGRNRVCTHASAR